MIIFLSAMLFVVYKIKASKLLIRFYTLLVVGNVLMLFSGLFSSSSINLNQNNQGTISFIFFLVIGLPIFLIQKEIFLTNEVTADILKGGIAAYVMLGLTWASFYNALYTLNPGAFNGVIDSQYQADLLHFSFITLTTVGYGDITPFTALARTAVDLEAIAGVMYPSILIARLVSLYNTHSQESP
ncbi:MAG TPA: two pore domain potassium channel family protein [Leptolyngbyaceae cyanobacterium M33_DOE_097]|nr:two pore domain potassium channel family protein [Leptolyngbyaceae cyanobacterium M33_DOE_097]